jgi:hypothetical protein
MSPGRFRLRGGTLVFTLALLLAAPLAAGPTSGPQPGERPLPFTSNMVTGPHRGRQYCYVCELKEEPSILIFARAFDAPTGQLLEEVRDAVRRHREQKLFGWVVFLGERGSQAEADLEHQARAFAQQHRATTVPVAALGDPEGPPGYLIAPEAAVTVVLFRHGAVVANRAFTRQQWTPRAARQALRDLPALLSAQPPDAPPAAGG